MARLPEPGGDVNGWAKILNEYLLITHDSDGTQRAGSIGGGALQDGAISLRHLHTASAPTQSLSKLQALSAPTDDMVLASDGDDLVWKSAQLLAAPVRQTTINVADYGAMGDGVTDDTAAIQSALSAAPQGGSVVFPYGVFMTTGIKINNKGTALVGAARWGTRIKRIAGSTAPLLDISGSGTGANGGVGHIRYISLNNIMLDGSSLPGVLLRSYYADTSIYREVNFIHCKGMATDLVEVWDTRFDSCTWENCGSLTEPAILLRNSTGIGTFGYSTDNTNQIHFISCRIEGFRNGAIKLDGLAGGSTALLNGIFFVATKMETAVAAGPVFQIMSGTTVIYATQLYIAITGLDPVQITPIDAIVDSASQTVMDNVYVQWGPGTGLANSTVRILARGPHTYQEISSFYPTEDPVLATIVAAPGTDVTIGSIWSNRGTLSLGTFREVAGLSASAGLRVPLRDPAVFSVSDEPTGKDLIKVDDNASRPALIMANSVDTVGFSDAYLTEKWRIIGATGAARFAGGKFQIEPTKGYIGLNATPFTGIAMLIKPAVEGDRGLTVVRPSSTATNRLMEFQDENFAIQGMAIDSNGRPVAVGTPPRVTPGSQVSYANPGVQVRDIGGNIVAAVRPSPTAPGTICTLTFSRAYLAAPLVITLTDHSIVQSNLYISARSTTSFTVSTRAALQGGTILNFDYLVVA